MTKLEIKEKNADIMLKIAQAELAIAQTKQIAADLVNQAKRRPIDIRG